jgi:hypothetical protein
VVARDAFGNETGATGVNAVLSSDDGQQSDVVVDDDGNARYTPASAGNASLAVKLDGDDIDGSPFSIQVVRFVFWILLMIGFFTRFNRWLFFCRRLRQPLQLTLPHRLLQVLSLAKRRRLL